MEVLEVIRTGMWIIAAATALVTLGLALVLGYHWHEYSKNPAVSSASILTFCIVSSILLLALFGSIPA